MSNTTYTIHLEQFEGPFDLMLFFIQRDELDIEDIPIAKITNDFLDYIHQLQEMDIDVAAEFMLFAATLMRIKAKMLLPRQPVNEEGIEIDPRQELVDRIMEYKRYKDILDEMRDLEQRRADWFQRGNALTELQQHANTALVDIELEHLSLTNLLRAFQKVMINKARREMPVHTIARYPYTIRKQQRSVFKLLDDATRCDFEALFAKVENRIHAIVQFLALLELANLQIIQVDVAPHRMNAFEVSRGARYADRDEVLSGHRSDFEEE